MAQNTTLPVPEHTGPETVFTRPFSRIQQKLRLLLAMGKLLMENGANTNHIQRDLRRTTIYMGIPEDDLNIHINYHTIMVNVNDETHSSTAFRKVYAHKVNMNALTELSRLPWRALEENWTLERFARELERVETLPPLYPLWLSRLAICLGSGALTILFGGTLPSAVITVLATLLGLLGNQFCQRMRFNVYVGITAGAFLATMTTGLSYTLFADKQAFLYAMISCTLFMIPGVPMINAIDDLLNNNIVSGMTRLCHTFLIVSGITFGIAMAVALLPVPNFTAISVLPDHLALTALAAAFVVAGGFAVYFNVPRRLLLLISLGGLLSLAIRNTMLVSFHMYGPEAAFVGAAAIGVIMGRLAGRLDTSILSLSIPAVVPLIPGVFFYRFLFAILEIHYLDASSLMGYLQTGITAILIIITISVGITVSNMFGRYYLDMKEQRRLETLLERRAEM